MTAMSNNLFRFPGRYDLEISAEARHKEWEKYWAHLDRISVTQDTDLSRYFVNDVFHDGELVIKAPNSDKGLVQLLLVNVWAIERLGELNGNDWIREHVRRNDFLTLITFQSIDMFQVHLSGYGKKQYYSHSEIDKAGEYLILIIDLVGYGGESTYIKLSFKNVIIEDITQRIITRYASLGNIAHGFSMFPP